MLLRWYASACLFSARGPVTIMRAAVSGLARGGHPRSAGEDVVAVALRSDRGSARRAPGRYRRTGPSAAAAWRSRCRQRNTAPGSVRSRTPGRPATPASPGASFKINTEMPKILLRHVDPTAIEIFVDVAQEVRQLERQPERPGRRLRRLAGGLEHRAASSPR